MRCKSENAKHRAIEMEAERKLYQYPGLKEMEKIKYQELLDAVCEKEDFIASVGSPNMDGMPKAPGKTSDPTYRKALVSKEIYEKRIEKIESDLNIIKEQIAEIDRATAQLTSIEQTIIRERYFNLGKATSYFDIALNVNYSERQCARINRRALRKIHTNLKDVRKCPI